MLADIAVCLFCVVLVPEMERTCVLSFFFCFFFCFTSSCALTQRTDAEEEPAALPFPSAWGRALCSRVS